MNRDEFTIGEIADMLEEPPARVGYIIKKLRIKPNSRIGIIRLFGQDKIKEIKDGLFNIQIRHG